MQKRDPIGEIENALMRLMPVGLSEGMQTEMEDRFDELSGVADFAKPPLVRFPKWIAACGIAAALVLGFIFFPRVGKDGRHIALQHSVVVADAPGVVLLDEADRVERVSDDGLFVDSGGSAVRKVRVRVVGESRIRDEETGIVVTLAEPREEMYLVPVSAF